MNNTQPVYQKKRVLAFRKSHICSARLGLPSWKKKHVAFLRCSIADLMCLEDVWRAPSGILLAI